MHILIVRLSAIGDVIQSVPIACALRDHFPDASIAWAVTGRTADLLEGHEAIDEVIRIPKGWLKSPKTIWRLRRELRAKKFDIALDAQGLTKAALLSWLSGARRRIGFGKPWGRELTPWLNTELADAPGPHMVERNIQLLKPLGIVAPTIRFAMPEREEDRRRAEEIVEHLHLQGGFAIINPGAGWPSKLWPTERFAAVATHLGQHFHLPTLVVWAGGEKKLAEEIVEGSQEFARLAPETSLTELGSLARKAKIFIASDTGPLHLAAAVGTPCVGLYGPWPAAKHGPWGEKNIAIQKAEFSGTTREKRRAPKEIIGAIAVEDVCEACGRILNG